MNYRTISGNEPQNSCSVTDGGKARLHSPGWASRFLPALYLLNGIILFYPISVVSVTSTMVGIMAIGGLLSGDLNIESIVLTLTFLGGPAGIVGILMFLAGKRRWPTTAMLAWGCFSYGWMLLAGYVVDIADEPFPLESIIWMTPLAVGAADVLVNLFVSKDSNGSVS